MWPVAEGALELVASDVHVGVEEASASGQGHVHEADAVPSAGRKKDLESGSDSEPALAGDSTLVRQSQLVKQNSGCEIR